MLSHRLDGLEHSKQLRSVGGRKLADPADERGSDQSEQAARERVPGNRTEVGAVAGRFLADGGAELGEVRGGLFGTGGMLDHSLPLGFGPEDGVAECVPELRGNGGGRGTIRVPRPYRPPRLLRGSTAFSTG